MSISVRGTVVISRKSGKRGAFNVGELSTEIGNFEVKDACIEEFDEGRYTGTFVINWIECESFAWKGKVFVKTRAQLAEVLIDEGEAGVAPEPAQPPVADPIDGKLDAKSDAAPTDRPEPEAGAPLAPAPRAAVAKSEQESQPSGGASDDAALFGLDLFELVREHQALKLDPTVDRVLFRAQRDRLKDLGYGFDPKTQTWSAR